MLSQPKLPVLSSSFAYFGVLHMLHSDLRAQFTFPHLFAGAKLISFGSFCHDTHPVRQVPRAIPNIWVAKCSAVNGRMYNPHVRFALPVVCTKEASAFFSQGFANLCPTCFHHLCIRGFVCGTRGRHSYSQSTSERHKVSR